MERKKHKCIIDIKLKDIGNKIFKIFEDNELCDKEMLAIIELVKLSIITVSTQRWIEKQKQIKDHFVKEFEDEEPFEPLDLNLT